MCISFMHGWHGLIKNKTILPMMGWGTERLKSSYMCVFTNLQIHYFSFSCSDHNLSLDIGQYVLDTTTAVTDGPVGLWPLSQPRVIRDQA